MKRVILFVMRGYRLCSSDDDDDNMRVPSQPWLEDRMYGDGHVLYIVSRYIVRWLVVERSYSYAVRAWRDI